MAVVFAQYRQAGKLNGVRIKEELMIHIDRPSEKPAALISEKSIDSVKKLREYYRYDVEKRGQSRLLLDEWIWNETIPDLYRLFSGKCSYCERTTSQEEALVDHFRPFSDVIGLENKIFKDGYWWLAFDWDNLYLACRNCLSSKSNHFPVFGDHALAEARGVDLHAEHALLIDPCYDQPDKYLTYDSDGFVKSIEPEDLDSRANFGDNSRGQITIETIGLNRSELLSVRRKLISEVLDQWRQLIDVPPDTVNQILPLLTESISNQAPFAGMVRYLLSSNLKRALEDPAMLDPKKHNQLAPLMEKFGFPPITQLGIQISEQVEVGSTIAQPEALVKRPRPLKHTQKPRGQKSKPISVGTSYINKIEIKNFKAISMLVLKMRDPFLKTLLHKEAF